MKHPVCGHIEREHPNALKKHGYPKWLHHLLQRCAYCPICGVKCTTTFEHIADDKFEDDNRTKSAPANPKTKGGKRK